MVEDTSTIERTTAAANCMDLAIINQAIASIAGAQYCISDDEFYAFFNGLTFWQTLNQLTSMKGLPLIFHAEIAKKAH